MLGAEKSPQRRSEGRIRGVRDMSGHPNELTSPLGRYNRSIMMLKSLRLLNFRCFTQLELSLSPLTALVGPNASGKTAILEALDPQANISLPADVWRWKTCPSEKFHPTGEEAHGRSLGLRM